MNSYDFLKHCHIPIKRIRTADLLMTILDPSIEETAVLALIVVLRILLSWSLSKEIEMNTKKKEEVRDGCGLNQK